MNSRNMSVRLFWTLLLFYSALCYGECVDIDWDNEYDYIVVGSGASGSVVASRLSEDRDRSVLLLEAGGDATDPFVRVPDAWTAVFANPDLDWGYETEPQSMAAGKQPIHWPQAKMMGGCTSHNAMMYVRGSKHDYDRWEELGNRNWSYDAVLPYFKKSERMLHPTLAQSDYHNDKGPMQVRLNARVPIIDAFINASEEIGLKETADYNGKNHQGIGDVQTLIGKKGERISTYEAFIKPVMGRWNLKVVMNAMVTKLSFSSSEARVDGVYFTKGEQEFRVSALREVIVSAGGIGSSALLLRSGIGPRKHLQEIGIPVMADLPVGENLRDHPAVPLSFHLNTSAFWQVRRPFTFDSLFDHLFVGKGPLSELRISTAFYNLPEQPAKDKFPYIQFVPYMVSEAFQVPGFLEMVKNGQKITPEMLKQLEKIDNYSELVPVNINLVLLHVSTLGKVTLKSTDPKVNPRIEYNYYSHPDDVRYMISALRYVAKLVDTSTMKQLKMSLSHHSDCSNEVYDTDAYWKCYLFHSFITVWHYVGTCKMAPDSTGVVDDRLRVKGVSGLRVADSSIMPLLPSGNPVAPSIMIGEKAADMIKMDNEEHSMTPNSSLALGICISTVILFLIWRR